MFRYFNKTTPLILSCKNGWTDVALKILDQYEDAEVDSFEQIYKSVLYCDDYYVWGGTSW